MNLLEGDLEKSVRASPIIDAASCEVRPPDFLGRLILEVHGDRLVGSIRCDNLREFLGICLKKVLEGYWPGRYSA